MINKNKKTKIQVIHLGNNLSQKNALDKSNKKTFIESYNSKAKNINNNNNKYEYYSEKKLNLEMSSTFEKNNNLSLFSLLSSKEINLKIIHNY